MSIQLAFMPWEADGPPVRFYNILMRKFDISLIVNFLNMKLNITIQ